MSKWIVGLGWILTFGFMGCNAKPEVKRTEYRILASSPLEVLPFLLTDQPGAGGLQQYDWQVIIDTEGTLAERLERHDVDFYTLDFFQFYSEHQSEGESSGSLALMALPSDVQLVVRKSILASDNWRLGMSSSTLSDYLLDYWLRDEDVTRIQVRDALQGMQLMRDNELDGMVLPSSLARMMVEDGQFVIYRNSLDEVLRLSLLIELPNEELLLASTALELDERNAHIIQDYRSGMAFYAEHPELLDAQPLSALAKENFLLQDELDPFLSPKSFEHLRNWRLRHTPFSPSWSYENLLWLPPPA
jgi:hypothetical protein